jgi:hypothetical protein
MYPLSMRRWLSGLFACFSLLSTFSYAQSNLVANGTFGTATYSSSGSTFNSSWAAWSSGGTTSLLTTVTSPGASYYDFYSPSANVWGCISVDAWNRATLAEHGIQVLKPNTHYKLTFAGIRDVSALPATDVTKGQPASLWVSVKSMGYGDFLMRDTLLSPQTSAKIQIGYYTPISYDFTTPVATNSSNRSNFGSTSLTFQFEGKRPNNTGRVCITNVGLQEVSDAPASARVVVNTYGYAVKGPKIGVLVLPAGTNISGYKWKLIKDGGNSLPQEPWSTSINFYAVNTGADGLPLKNGQGLYTLQKNPDSSYKVVGGTGTGGPGGYLPPNGGVIASGNLVADADSGDNIYTLDFSSYGQPQGRPMSIPDGTGTPSLYHSTLDNKDYYMLSGSSFNPSTDPANYQGDRYTLQVVDGTGKSVAYSRNFAIKIKPFDSIKNDALFSFYHQRSGQAITPVYNNKGEGLENVTRRHNAGHAPDTAVCWANASSKVDLHGNDWGSATSSCIGYTKDVSGGWYDAADHGKYVVNGGVALWTLQNMVERLQNKNTLNTAFPQGTLSLPATMSDSNSPLAISDLLAESRIEMEWMLKMQVPDMFKMKVPLGYQDKQLASASDLNGIYQVDLQGQKLALSAAGAVAFGGGNLPRLRMKVNLKEVDVGGMVFHAVHDRNWTGIPLDPSKDTQERVLMYPTTAATLNFAAVAAQCARIWKTVDPAFADRCYNAATKAWTKAKQFRTGFTDVYGNVISAKSDIFRYEYSNQGWDAVDASMRNNSILKYGFALNPMFNGGGAYGDLRVGDEYYWAGAELYLASAARGTADVSYHTYGKQQGVLSGTDINDQYSKCEQAVEPIQCYSWINGFDWQNTTALGTLSLLTYSNGALASANAKANLLAFADTLVAQTNTQGYKFAKQTFDPSNRDTHYEWGANGGVLNRAMLLGAAADLQTDSVKKTSYLSAAANSMGYLLGRNTLERSFISGYGNNSMSNPHHRWFAKHADVVYPAVPAGFIAGGPNTRDIPALRANAPRYETQADVNYALSNGDLQATLGGISDRSQRYFDSDVVANCMNENAATLPSYTPQKCYADHYRSFATNEVAINWQAPLVWVTQFLSESY